MTEEFCACGHDKSDHDPITGDCIATEPEPNCSCGGYRKGKRAQ